MAGFEIRWVWSGEEAPSYERGSVWLEADAAGLRIEVEAPFHDDPAPGAVAGPTARLWEHEVVELFIVGSNGHYTEIELGPHGHHLVLRLSGVRQLVDQLHPLRYTAHVEGGRWTGSAVIDRALLPPGPHRAAAFAIHGTSDRRYLASLPLGGEKPDFHQPDRFAPCVLP